MAPTPQGSKIRQRSPRRPQAKISIALVVVFVLVAVGATGVMPSIGQILGADRVGLFEQAASQSISCENRGGSQRCVSSDGGASGTAADRVGPFEQAPTSRPALPSPSIWPMFGMTPVAPTATSTNTTTRAMLIFACGRLGERWRIFDP